jgi:putative transposase
MARKKKIKGGFPVLSGLAGESAAVIAHQRLEMAVLKRHLKAAGVKKLGFTDEERRGLTDSALAMSPQARKQAMNIVRPETLRRWNKVQEGKQAPGGRRAPRKEAAAEKEVLVLQLARQNPSWGRKRIAAQLRLAGVSICASRVRQILKKNGIKPSPRGGPWKDFLEAQAELWQSDFFEVTTGLLGKIALAVLFFINIRTRQVVIAGVTQHPNQEWLVAVAKTLVAGPLKGATCIVRDGDKKFTPAYDQVFKDAGILVQKTRPRTPDMNAFAERFVRTVKEECTSRLLFLNQRQVEYALSEFLAHYHAERCHQGFPENVPPNPDPVFERRKGRMVVKKRLGGLLKSYHRLAS